METLELLLTKALWVEPVEAVTDCRDAKDNKCLELALAASATVIVSGDDDLLVLNPWRGVRILTSAQFVKWAAAWWHSTVPAALAALGRADRKGYPR